LGYYLFYILIFWLDIFIELRFCYYKC
jgi:hypothetical protein